MPHGNMKLYTHIVILLKTIRLLMDHRLNRENAS